MKKMIMMMACLTFSVLNVQAAPRVFQQAKGFSQYSEAQAAKYAAENAAHAAENKAENVVEKAEDVAENVLKTMPLKDIGAPHSMPWSQPISPKEELEDAGKDVKKALKWKMQDKKRIFN